MVVELRFRKAARRDAEILLRWRNDPLTRQNSLHMEEIEPEGHERWLAKTLKDSHQKLYIAERNHVPVGIVRLDGRQEAWELSWTVAPEHRGKGIGKAMVQAATKIVKGSLIAKIKKDNPASIQIAKDSGFQKVSDEGDLTIWKTNP